MFLLLNHHRKVTSAELISHFWSEDEKSPTNSLKNMLHKTRALLHAMFPGTQDLILTRNGSYDWNSDVSIQLDTEAFERICRSAKTLPDAERIIQEQEAFSLYTGEILPGVSGGWLDHLNTYYRSMFIDLCKSLVFLLQADERWDDVVHICHHAYSTSPEIEEFTVYFMRALVANGTPDLAIKHYEEYRAMLWRDFGLIPSEQVEQAHTLAVDFNCQSENCVEELLRQLTQVPESPKAFLCSLLVFRHLVQLELRNMIRGKHESSIVFLNVSKSDPRHLPTDARRLERVLLYGLRAADPFAKLNMGCFALLLSGASAKNAQKVVNRIYHNFQTIYPRSKACLQHHIFPLKAENC